MKRARWVTRVTEQWGCSHCHNAETKTRWRCRNPFHDSHRWPVTAFACSLIDRLDGWVRFGSEVTA